MNEDRPGAPDERRGEWRGNQVSRRRHFSGLFLGLILIWLGVSFFLKEQGFIPDNDWWKYFIIGLGVIFLIDSWVRYGLSRYAGMVRGRGIAGVILITVGVAFLIGGNWWPLILIVLGLVILVNSLWR